MKLTVKELTLIMLELEFLEDDYHFRANEDGVFLDSVYSDDFGYSVTKYNSGTFSVKSLSNGKIDHRNAYFSELKFNEISEIGPKLQAKFL